MELSTLSLFTIFTYIVWKKVIIQLNTVTRGTRL